MVFFGCFAIGMLLSALNAKALGASILYGLGLVCVYPSDERALLLCGLYLPAVLLAVFRD